MRIKKSAFLLIVLPVIFILHSGFLETTSGLNQKGNKAYGEKRYETALDSYRKAQIKNPEDSTIRYNVGTALYQMDQFQEAETQLAQSLAKAKTKDLKALAYYNHGNAQYRLGQFDKAIESYKKALDLNPSDKDAKFNLEVLQKKKSMFDIKQDQRDQNRKDKPPPPQNQEEQQKDQQQQGGGQNKQDQQSQNQKGDQQNKGDKQDQEQQEKQPSGGQQGSDQEEKQNQDQKEQDQDQSQKQDQKDQKEKQEPEQNQNQQSPASPEEGKDQENEQPQNQKSESEQQKEQGEQPSQPQEQEGNQEEKPGQEDQGESPKPLLQGQMSQESAVRILDALKTSEQELQALRRPPRQQAEHEPLKDW